ncbi:MAG: glycosyltransferase [Candidatus Zixiibacteriota bacterium]
MDRTLQDYTEIAGGATIRQLSQLGERLSGARVVHVNSTQTGGGVAEILGWMVPFMRELGLDARWEVVTGPQRYFEITKMIHNSFQGQPGVISKKDWKLYLEVNEENAARLRDVLRDADFVIIHDPQPAALLHFTRDRIGKWIWRAHIDLSNPNHENWKFFRSVVAGYDASICSIVDFARSLPHRQVIVAPSIDPLSEKNHELAQSEVAAMRTAHGLDPDRPLLVQISRFDRFKDPLGVIRAYQLVKHTYPVQLVLAGGGADDDPEGDVVLEEVMEEAKNDADIHVLKLPSGADRQVNAIQRAADIILQKSTREGFGLTVTEALWKGKPVIGGDTGGIRLQVINYHTGFLVSTPEGAAHRIRYLLHHRDMMSQMGRTGREFVGSNFLLTRHLREYLTLLLALKRGDGQRILYV